MNAEAFDEEVFGFGVAGVARDLAPFLGVGDEKFMIINEIGNVVFGGEFAFHLADFAESGEHG